MMGHRDRPNSHLGAWHVLGFLVYTNLFTVAVFTSDPTQVETAVQNQPRQTAYQPQMYFRKLVPHNQSLSRYLVIFTR